MAAEPATPRYLNWSQYSIQFSREDQWTSVGNVGHYPLVLVPTIAGMTVTKVLIDGGAGLNIIFLETLRKMGLQLAGMITPTKHTFLWHSTRQGSNATWTNHSTSYLWDSLELPYKVHQV